VPEFVTVKKYDEKFAGWILLAQARASGGPS
jgi:hypothetical protein